MTDPSPTPPTCPTCGSHEPSVRRLFPAYQHTSAHAEPGGRMTTWQMDEIDRLNALARERRWWRRLLRALHLRAAIDPRLLAPTPSEGSPTE